MTANPGQGAAPLQIPVHVLAKLDQLEWDAFGLIHAIWDYHTRLGYSGRIRYDELPAATARRIPKGRLNAAFEQLRRQMQPHRDGTETPLWLDRDGDDVVLAPWFVKANPSPEVWHDDVERFRRARDKELHSMKCSDLKQEVRKRDRNLCRYCGIRVEWGKNNTTAGIGGTYDHVDPDEGNLLSNLVVACHRDNGRKRNRTPEQWIAEDPAEALSLLPEGTTDTQAAAARARLKGKSAPVRRADGSAR